jgi:hypothetical protein
LSRTQPAPILHRELRMTAQIFQNAEVKTGCSLIDHLVLNERS